MKKCLVILLMALLLFSAGCSIPVKKSSSDITDDYTGENLTESDGGMEGSDSGTSADESKGQVKSANISSAGKDNQENKRLSVVIYYQSEGGYVVPATRKVWKQEGIAKAAVGALIDSSITREELEYFGLYPILPADTEIRGLTIKDGTATIDFNSKLLEYGDKITERNIVSSIVYTLTEFKTVENVKILVDGVQKGKLKYGTDLSMSLNRENTLINCDRVNLKQGMEKYDVFLVENTENQYSYDLPVSIEYPESTEDDIPAKVIATLAKTYKDKNLYTQIPQKTKLLNSSIDGNVLTLDFSSEIKSYGGGTNREEGILKQILYSMKQVDGVEKIKILINGKEDTLPEGSDISGEMVLPADINDYIDKQD